MSDLKKIIEHYKEKNEIFNYLKTISSSEISMSYHSNIDAWKIDNVLNIDTQNKPVLNIKGKLIADDVYYTTHKDQEDYIKEHTLLFKHQYNVVIYGSTQNLGGLNPNSTWLSITDHDSTGTTFVPVIYRTYRLVLTTDNKTLDFGEIPVHAQVLELNGTQVENIKGTIKIKSILHARMKISTFIKYLSYFNGKNLSISSKEGGVLDFSKNTNIRTLCIDLEDCSEKIKSVKITCPPNLKSLTIDNVNKAEIENLPEKLSYVCLRSLSEVSTVKRIQEVNFNILPKYIERLSIFEYSQPSLIDVDKNNKVMKLYNFRTETINELTLQTKHKSLKLIGFNINKAILRRGTVYDLQNTTIEHITIELETPKEIDYIHLPKVYKKITVSIWYSFMDKMKDVKILLKKMGIDTDIHKIRIRKYPKSFNTKVYIYKK